MEKFLKTGSGKVCSRGMAFPERGLPQKAVLLLDNVPSCPNEARRLQTVGSFL